MENSRQELLKNLIEKITRVIQDIHKEQHFPYGNLVLRRQQMMIMFFINKNKGNASVNDIAKFLRVTPSAVTQFVDELVEKKLVEREKNINDRRGINIKLSPKTKEKFSKFEKDYLIGASKTFGSLSDEEINDLIRLLGKIKSAAV
jgi:DNA-binding MarR family transcriptional regulator